MRSTRRKIALAWRSTDWRLLIEPGEFGHGVASLPSQSRASSGFVKACALAAVTATGC